MLIVTIIRLCIIAYLALIVIDLIRSRRYKRFVFSVLVLLGLIILDMLLTNATIGYVAFGAGSSPISVLFIMFTSIVFGVAARYIFYLQNSFSWMGFLKPICISPILLLPLIGSVQGMQNLNAMQVVSFSLLAFQNGFFWQAVLQQARPKKTA
jgi:hypothetical protein